jgi:hypothetical protein
MILLLTKYRSADKMEKNMMGEECSKYELEERRIQVFGRET